MANHPYYLPLSAETFEAIHFLGVEARNDGPGANRTQKHTPEGVPVWTLTMLIKRTGSIPEVELFTWVASQADADRVSNLPPMTPVKVHGLEAGKWSRANTDRTTWTFRVSGIEPTK